VQPRIIYAYTADDERLFALDVSTGTTHWTLRGFDNKVLRDFRQNGSAWSVERDYVYRDGLLLVALKSGGAVEHYSLDHLGSPRLVTDAAGHKIGYHVYWPFGEEWSPGIAQDGSPLQFTGHERDADPSGANAPLDYMHARYYGAGWGRFLSVDPTWDSADLGSPQSWNRYSYVQNNPLNHTDASGKIVDTVLDGAFIAYDLLDMAATKIAGDKITTTQKAALAADLACAVIPLATGGGVAVRTAGRAEKVVHATEAASHIASASEKGTKAAIHMDEAVAMAAEHVEGKGTMDATGKGTNYQFRNTGTNADGKTETKIGRLDVNPADPHVQQQGPHLNLEGRSIAEP
jgi:RHS repeat-associated protein